MKLARNPFVRAALAALAFASPAYAQSGPELMMKPFAPDLRLDLEADASITDTGHTKGADESMQVGIAEVRGRIRMTPGELASPRFGFEAKYLNLDSSVPGLPESFYDFNVGAAAPVGKVGEWVVAVGVGGGYAGQSPFGDGNGWYGRASVLAFTQIDETSRIGVGIDYDGNRTFKPDCPLPGFAYNKRIDKTLALTVGVPVTSVEWQPVDHLRVQVDYVLLDNFRARVGYEFGNGWEVFGSLGQRTDAFHLDDSRYSDDRLIFQQRRAEVGVTYRTKNAGVGERDVELTLAAGYAFDGELSVGFDSSNSRLLRDISDEPYVRAALQVRF
ncbi:MAG TPA: hypothetical protein VF796_23410 [Humisphaera sp.]